jgi:hypothetical protein
MAGIVLDGPLGELIGVLEDKVGALAAQPSKVEIEFCAALSGDCEPTILSSDKKAGFKVKLSWEWQTAGKA